MHVVYRKDLLLVWIVIIYCSRCQSPPDVVVLMNRVRNVGVRRYSFHCALIIANYRPYMGRQCFDTCLFVCQHGGYLPWKGEVIPTLDGGRVCLPWMGGVPTLHKGGSAYLGQGEEYLSWTGDGAPSLEWRGVLTLDRRGYLPWMGEEIPTLPWMGEGVPTLDSG